MTEQEKDHARANAEAALENIVAMVKRLHHAAECDGDTDECDLTDKEICDGLARYYSPGQEVNDEDREEYHDEEKAREQIQEDALEVSVRASGWRSPGETPEADEYRILITTGGPACQVKGDLDAHMQPEDADIQYQDWGTPWTNLPTTQEEDDALLEYARQFYLGM